MPVLSRDARWVCRAESASSPAPTARCLLFYTGTRFPDRFREGAFIVFHGSWNRAPLPQAGYKVVFVPFNGHLPGADWEVFADGFKGAEELANPADAAHRPTGIAQGPEGELYISSSVSGRIWRVDYVGK